eukprot:scaffold12.g8282.t1
MQLASIEDAVRDHRRALAWDPLSLVPRHAALETDSVDAESRSRAVEQALEGECPADVLLFIKILYDPVHVREAFLGAVAAAAPPASPTGPAAAAAGASAAGHQNAPANGAGAAAVAAPAVAAAAAAPQVAQAAAGNAAAAWGFGAGPAAAPVPVLVMAGPEAVQPALAAWGFGAPAAANAAAPIIAAPPPVPGLWGFGVAPASAVRPAAKPAPSPRNAALGAKAEAVLRLADKLDAPLIVEVCDRFLVSELSVEGGDILKWLTIDAAWLLFESLLKACRSAHSQPAGVGGQQGGLLAQVRAQLPSAGALEAWSGVGTLFGKHEPALGG